MEPNQFIYILMLPVFAYLMGAIPFGLILTRIFKSVDIRQIGSGNIGATNARRAGGWAIGLATLTGDVLKGAVPVYLAGVLIADSGDIICKLYVSFIALTAFSGHLYPVYLKFKTGGKGVATAAGCFAILSFGALLVSLLTFCVTVMLSKRVSAGSIAAATMMPAAVFWIDRSLILSGGAFIISILIIFKHKDNIRRLVSGTEPTL